MQSKVRVFFNDKQKKVILYTRLNELISKKFVNRYSELWPTCWRWPTTRWLSTYTACLPRTSAKPSFAPWDAAWSRESRTIKGIRVVTHVWWKLPPPPPPLRRLPRHRARGRCPTEYCHRSRGNFWIVVSPLDINAVYLFFLNNRCQKEFFNLNQNFIYLICNTCKSSIRYIRGQFTKKNHLWIKRSQSEENKSTEDE